MIFVVEDFIQRSTIHSVKVTVPIFILEMLKKCDGILNKWSLSSPVGQWDVAQCKTGNFHFDN
jgi:hypothetical protein